MKIKLNDGQLVYIVGMDCNPHDLRFLILMRLRAPKLGLRILTEDGKHGYAQVGAMNIDLPEIQQLNEKRKKP